MNKILKKLMAVMAAVLLLGCVSAAAVDLETPGNCSLTFYLAPDEDKLADDSMVDGYKELADVTVDVALYKVATMVDDYEYKATDAFDSLDLTGYKDLEDNSQLVEAAAALAADAVPVWNEGVTGGTATADTLDPGLYLLVVEGDNDGVKYAGAHKYTFSPILVSLPSMEGYLGEDEDGNPTDWSGADLYDVVLYLKPERAARMGDVTITKQIDEVRDGVETTFVFEIEAKYPEDSEYMPGEVVYSNVVSLVFDGETSESRTLTGVIPVGAEVTVTEVYSGAGYDPAGAETQTLTMEVPEDDPATEDVDESTTATPAVSFTFENTLDEDETPKGSSVENRFTKGTTSWTVTQVYDYDYDETVVAD